jgi:hypothetical protein
MKLLLIILALLAVASNANGIDISINTDTNIIVNGEGLEFDDTLTINGELFTGISEIQFSNNLGTINDFVIHKWSMEDLKCGNYSRLH